MLKDLPTKLAYIKGTGAISAAGDSISQSWQNVFNQKSFIVDGVGKISEESVSRLRETLFRKKPKLSNTEFQELPLLLSVSAMEEALECAGWKALGPEDGFIFATTTGHVSTWDQPLMDSFKKASQQAVFEKAFFLERLGLMQEKLVEYLGFTGKCILVTSACAASTQALCLAREWILSGKVRRCLVGGTEVLAQLTLQGFKCFQLLSEKPAKPFDSKRSGINLSEASAFVCLDSDPKGARAVLSGGGIASDAYHMTSPHPEGRGSFLAMEQALRTANIHGKDLSWIHAHGTGSVNNDLSEGNAIATLLNGSESWTSSTKSVHGHALAASGILETALCVESIEKQTLLPNVGLLEMDPKIPLRICVEPIQMRVEHILKNTLGFGGANAAIVLSHPEAFQ